MKDVVLGYYAALRAGEDISPFVAADVVLHVPGDHPTAGDWRGVDGLQRFMAESRTRYDTQTVETLDVLVGDAHVAVYNHARGKRADHPDLDNFTVHLLRIEDGCITEIWFHNRNQSAVDAFWRD